MRELRQLAQEVTLIFDEMSSVFSQYQKDSGLTCFTGCGKCCLNPEVQASVLEMIPMALSFYDRGIAESMLEKLSIENKSSCPIYLSYSLDGSFGGCSEYLTRPTICRVFGASARNGKKGKELSVCRKIKENKIFEYQSALAQPDSAPLMEEWAKKITVLSYQYSSQILPIGQALTRALETVLTKAFYSSSEENQYPENDPQVS